MTRPLLRLLHRPLSQDAVLLLRHLARSHRLGLTFRLSL
jgi:hypothetical protein